MSTKKPDNLFEAEVIDDGEEKYAQIENVRIVVSTEMEGHVKLLIRPEDIILSEGPLVSSARNMLKGLVTDIVADDHSAKVFMDVGIPMCALITKRSLEKMNIKKGDILFAIFKTMSVKIVN